MNAERRVLWLDLAAVFLLALALRLGLAISLPANDSVFWDQPYWTYARNLSEGKGFWMPNPYGQGLDIPKVYAFRPPLFPFLWGMTYKITGGAYWPVRSTFALLGALTCVLAYLAAREMFRRRSVSLVGGLLCALYPPLVWHSVNLMTEPLFIFFSTLCLLALFRTRSSLSWRWAVAAGLAAGLGILTRSVLVGFLPFMALWLWWCAGRRRRTLGLAVLFCATALLVMLPWVIRNAIVLKAFVPTTTDVGHGAYVANNEHSLSDPRGFWIPDDWSFVKTNPDERPGEVEVSRRLVREARAFLWAHPATAARLMAKRFVALWRFYPHEEFVSRRNVLIYALSYVPLFPFMLLGLWLAHKRAGDALADVALVDVVIFLTTAVHVAVLAMIRYREPLMPFLLPFAALALVETFRFIRERVGRSA